MPSLYINSPHTEIRLEKRHLWIRKRDADGESETPSPHPAFRNRTRGW